MSTYSIVATKDNKTYTGTMVGTSPFGPMSGSVIDAVVVPLIVKLGSNTFDPTLPDPCDSYVPAMTRFKQSPLTQNVPNLAFNGINVGSTQYINGFRRAEFWGALPGGTKNAAYQNTINFTYANAVTYSTTAKYAIVTGPFCGGQMGLISNTQLAYDMKNTILPALTSAGVVSSSKFVMKYDPASTTCCILGYHGAVGTPVQTYAVADWDTTSSFTKTVAGKTFLTAADASVASHEIAEWMDDPLVTNQTPPWGHAGQVPAGTCQTNWEAGDPLSGPLMPAITMSGYPYHMQELAYFSFFFNSSSTQSVGAYNSWPAFPHGLPQGGLMGGAFSSNASYGGPANACPNGGVAPFTFLPAPQGGTPAFHP